MPDRGFLYSSTSGAIEMTCLQTRLCDLLGIRHAILLAAMAGAPSTPELAGAVSRAGGLGVLGVSGMTVDAVFEATRAALACAGGGPIGVNAQLGPATPPTGDRDRIVAVLAPFRTELGLAPEPPARIAQGMATRILGVAGPGRAGLTGIAVDGRSSSPTGPRTIADEEIR